MFRVDRRSPRRRRLRRARRVDAAITLMSFTAEAQGNNAILIKWQTGTERDTTGFNLYRALSAAELGKAEPSTPKLVFIQGRGDALIGDSYSYLDTPVTPGMLYYYRLYEVSGAGVTGDVSEIVSARISAPTLTPTSTATATATATPTVTVSAGAAMTPTPTATGVSGRTASDQPTATRQFPNTPAPATSLSRRDSRPHRFRWLRRPRRPSDPAS